MPLDIATLESWLWNAACAIRGPVGAPKFKDHIPPLAFLERLSDVFEEELYRLAEEYGNREVALSLVEERKEGVIAQGRGLVRFYIPEEVRWTNIRKQDKGLSQYLTDAVRKNKHSKMVMPVEAELRKRVIEHLRELGFKVENGELALEGNSDKHFLRQLHDAVRRLALYQMQGRVENLWPRLRPYFADGRDINPEAIRPVLVEATTPWQHELFRLARLTWSLPYSKGYGRRLRFLILDEGNRNPEGQPYLMGILALQSPPLSFPPRDRRFRYPPGRKTELVNQTMDIHTLGALPPYSYLLGGKLVALAAASNEVREAYRRKYEGRRTEIEGRVLPAHLVALNTTSAFGRSSLYNRLKYNGEPIAISIGYTEGYGAFHLEPLYPLFREYLEAQGISTRGGYNVGPRIKWQTCVRALERLGLSGALLKHTIRREVFLFPLIHNLDDYMEGRTDEPEYKDLPFADLGAYWRERWLLPRVARVDGWYKWEAEQLLESLLMRNEANGVRSDER